MVKGKWLNLNMSDKPLLRIALILLPSCKIILVKIFFFNHECRFLAKFTEKCDEE